MAISRRLILFCTLVVLGACSNQYAYRLADWWLESQIEEYLDLNKDQQQRLATAIDGWHQWHQLNELPQYQSLLSDLQNLLKQDQINAEQLADFETRASQAWKRLLNKGGPLLADLVLELDQEQRQYLYKQMSNTNDELREKFTDRSEEERRKRGQKGMEKQLRKNLGKLSHEQKQAVQQWADKFQLGAEIELAERLRWQQQFRDIIEAPRDQKSQERLLALFENPRENWIKEKQDLEQYNTALRRELFIKLFELSSDKQKKRLQETIEDYQALLEKMSKQKL